MLLLFNNPQMQFLQLFWIDFAGSVDQWEQFAPNDPLFGIQPDMSVDYGWRLGQLAPRGEKGVLQVPLEQFMRLNCNPFFAYQLERMRHFVSK